VLAGAVEVDRHGDVGFVGLSGDLCRTHGT
jgi:hypothetical protein